MPVNKPTISYQLKTVVNTRPKLSNIIYPTVNSSVSPLHPRSNLRAGPKWKKSCYDQTETKTDVGDLSRAEIRQCTRMLRNVLANDENKSTSTDDFHFEPLRPRAVGFKSTDSSERFAPQSEAADEITEAESLTSVADLRQSEVDQQPPSQPRLCACQTEKGNRSVMQEPHRFVPSTDGRAAVCTRCHNLLPPASIPDRDGSTPFKPFIHDNEHTNTKIAHSPLSSTEYKSPLHRDSLGDDNIDPLGGLLQGKLGEIGLIARATRDADLDRLVSEIDRLFKQTATENAALITHLKTIAKTLKWENAGLKQRIKSQTESNHDAKSELRLLRQKKKQKIEELKLELQLKTEEVRQLTERDQSSMGHWKEKCHQLEKENEKVRGELQGLMLRVCQKDTEIVQVKHSSTQSEAKLKEQMHGLTLANQNLQADLSRAQEANRRHEQDSAHNQSVIKAAREHVVGLLERHGLDRTPPDLGHGDWLAQATGIQQVLSLVSASGSPASPIDFAAANYNNSYLSSSSGHTKAVHKDRDDARGLVRGLKDRCHSPSPSEVTLTLSPHGSECSLPISKDVFDGPWNLRATKAKMSSASSVMSTVSSLRSADDRDFRSGLQRLDSQINRLQSTLQSNMLCQ